MSKKFSQMIARGRFLTVFLLFFMVCQIPVFAAEEGGNKTDFIFHHVQDSHEWHLATIGHTHVTIPLPVILFEPGAGFHFFMSSDFVDADHNKVEVDGFYFDDHDHLVARDEARVFYDISITKNVASLFISVILLFWVFLSVAKRYKRDPLAAPK